MGVSLGGSTLGVSTGTGDGFALDGWASCRYLSGSGMGVSLVLGLRLLTGFAWGQDYL